MIIIVAMPNLQEVDTVKKHVEERHNFKFTNYLDSVLGKMDLEFATIKPMIEDDISLLQHELQQLIQDETLRVYISDE